MLVLLYDGYRIFNNIKVLEKLMVLLLIEKFYKL